MRAALKHSHTCSRCSECLNDEPQQLSEYKRGEKNRQTKWFSCHCCLQSNNNGEHIQENTPSITGAAGPGRTSEPVIEAISGESDRDRTAGQSLKGLKELPSKQKCRDEFSQRGAGRSHPAANKRVNRKDLNTVG